LDNYSQKRWTKELKYDFGLDSFCMDKFWATEAAFRTIMMGYNLMSLFRQIVLQSKSQATLSTLLKIQMLCIRKLDHKTCWKNNPEHLSDWRKTNMAGRII
jgi:hypothetical protein